MHRRLTAAAVAVSIVSLTVLATPVPAFGDEVRDGQWYLDALGVNKTHELSQGEGVTIGVVDGGVDATHPDLKDNVQAGKDFGTSEDKGLKDSDGHGTSTTSVIVGHGHGEANAGGIIGIAPRAKVISVGIDSAPDDFDYEWVGESIRWLVDQGVDIISVTTVTTVTPAISGKAVSYAAKKGIPVVSPAGNDEPEFDDILGEIEGPKTTLWPARASGAIPVTGSTKSGQFWDKSLTLRDASPQPQLGIAAPAEDIRTAERGGGYGTHSGTSGSAPIVAGTLALIKSAYPDLSYAQWVDRLLDTTDDKGPKGYDEKFGAGIVNPYRALTEETTFHARDEDQVSSPEDRLPLEEQGKGKSGSDESQSDKQDELTASSGSSLLMPVLVTVAAILAAATVIGVVVVGRRKQAKSPANQNIRS